MSLELPRLGAECLQRAGSVDFREAISADGLVEPAEETRHRRSIAQMGPARASHFRVVLARLHGRNRIDADCGLAATAFHHRLQENAGSRAVEPHGPAATRYLPDCNRKLVRLGNFYLRRQLLPHRIRHLGGVDEQGRWPAHQHQRIAERYRRVRNIAAANIEQPSDIMRIADDQRIGPALGKARLHAIYFLVYRLTRKFLPVQADLPVWWRGTTLPDSVDRIEIHRDERGLSLGERGGQTIHVASGMEARIISDPAALRRMIAKPLTEGKLVARHVFE